MVAILADYNCIVDCLPGDVHCLLHSVLSSWLNQLANNLLLTTLESIKAYMFVELADNVHHYLPFYQTTDEQCSFKGLHDYKQYNQAFGNLAPVVTANALNTTLIILNEDRTRQTVYVINVTPQDHSATSVLLHRCGEHKLFNEFCMSLYGCVIVGPGVQTC